MMVASNPLNYLDWGEIVCGLCCSFLPEKMCPNHFRFFEVLLAFVDHEADEGGERDLQWTVVRRGGSRENEQIEEDECGETGDSGDDVVDSEQIVGEDKTEEHLLGYQRETLHREVKVAGNHPAHFVCSVSIMPNRRPARLGLGVTFGPLLVQCGDERGEEGSGQDDGLYMGGGGIEASPLTQDEIEGCSEEMARRIGSSWVA